jgi:hypothetical protein
MTFPKARLAVSACLLVAWLLYLGYLVVETRDQVVLSKPQLMVAQAYVVVDIRNGESANHPAAEVTIEKVLWSTDAKDKQREGQRILLAELLDLAKQAGYRGPGQYLVPMNHFQNGFVMVSLPRDWMDKRIYPWNEETKAQLQPFLDMKN